MADETGEEADAGTVTTATATPFSMPIFALATLYTLEGDSKEAILFLKSSSISL
jgi:hypothetical protein